jgi:hypothetical protein
MKKATFDSLCYVTGNTLIMIREMGGHKMVSFVVSAPVHQANSAVQQTDNLTLLFHGASHTQQIDTTSGLDCMAVWTGMGTLEPL